VIAVSDLAPPPTEPLTPVNVRAWGRVFGFVFFLWGLAFTCVSTIVCATAVFVIFPFVRDPVIYFRISRAWASSILRAVGVQTEVTFEGPLPDGPVIFASNHQSVIDILVLFEVLPRPFVFVAKKAVFRFPFLGWAISAMHYIPIDRRRHNEAVASLQSAAVRIRGGLTTTVFPEGTRSELGGILPFKKGPFMLALDAQVPIVPVAVEGSLHVTPKKRWYVCPNTVRVLLGKPVSVQGREGERDALIAEVRTNIIRMNRRLGGLGGDVSTPIAESGWQGTGRPRTDD
jgi:1-acyl-sn-glycerol-3-phosphate acyltransferase